MTQVRTRADARGAAGPASTQRSQTISRRRGLPGGRAVVGGFLVAAAAVGVFGAYTSSQQGPRTQYAVAARDLSPGEHIDAGALRLVTMALPDEQRGHAFDDLAPLADATVVEPLSEGELVQDGSLVATGAEPGTRTLSFAVDAAHAVDAALRVGERADVLATFGTGADACTQQVAGALQIVAIGEATDALVGQGGVTLTVQVPTAATATAVAHAANAGIITAVRSTGAAPADSRRHCTPVAGTRTSGD